MMKFWLFSLLFVLPLNAAAELYITIIQGLDGSPEYGRQFNEQSKKIKHAAESVTDEARIRFLAGDSATRENILSHFAQLADSTTQQDRLAVFMVGHGSYDEYEYKFNVPGPDLTDEDLLEALEAQPAGIQLLVNTSSASGALQPVLKRDSRIVMTATRSGNERLAPRFGNYLAEAFTDPSADINKNNSITAEEVFDYAQRHVEDYFEHEGQLATEHAVMEGELAGQFVLARAGIELAQDADPELARLVRKRNEINVKIEELQLRKGEMDSGDYLDQLQQLMIELSIVQGEIEERNGNR